MNDNPNPVDIKRAKLKANNIDTKNMTPDEKEFYERKKKALQSLKDHALLSFKQFIKEEKNEGKPLNKPMKGDVKKSKVYVRDPKTGNVKKVNFGDKNMRIRKNEPERRKSFRARHKCDNPGPKTKARYWSCKAW